MAAGEVFDEPLAKAGPSLSLLFGPLDGEHDAHLRARVVAAQRVLTDWVLTSGDAPPWRLHGFRLIGSEGPDAARLRASVVAGEPRRDVMALIEISSPLRSGSWQIDLVVRVDCRCPLEHWDPHLVASRRVDARNPDAAVDRLEEVIDLAVEQLPSRTTAEWIALGEVPPDGIGFFAPRHHRPDDGWPALFEAPSYEDDEGSAAR
jgi:hypothetical protein